MDPLPRASRRRLSGSSHVRATGRNAGSLGERGRGSGVRVGSSEGVRGARRADGTWRLPGGDIETEEHRPTREGRGREEVTDCTVRRVDARAALGGMRLDVRRGMGAGGVEAGVGPRGGAREQELQGGGEEPEDARPRGTLRYAGHADVRTSLRSATAPTSTTPYMHTIRGPVGKSPASDSHRPRIEASAPEPQEM